MAAPAAPRTVATSRTAGTPPRTLVIACGALARDLLAVIEANGLDHLAVTCLPAILHNRPEQIPEAVFATPTYLLNGRVWSLGNPSHAQINAAWGALSP